MDATVTVLVAAASVSTVIVTDVDTTSWILSVMVEMVDTVLVDTREVVTLAIPYDVTVAWMVDATTDVTVLYAVDVLTQDPCVSIQAQAVLITAVAFVNRADSSDSRPVAAVGVLEVVMVAP